MFLTPIPLLTSFIFTQISLVVFIIKNSTFAFLYPSADINILFIQKKKNINYLHKVVNNFIYTQKNRFVLIIFDYFSQLKSFTGFLIFIFSMKSQTRSYQYIPLKSIIRLTALYKLTIHHHPFHQHYLHIFLIFFNNNLIFFFIFCIY